jgi:protein-S-isoprenylcysteine O-methyltransferase Ste14
MTVTDRDTAGVPIFPPLIYLGAMALGFLIQLVAPARLGPEWHGARLRTGGVLIAIAVAMIASAAIVFRRAGTTPNPTRPTTALVARGPYLFTRNPMYVAWAILCLAAALIGNSLWVAIMAIPAVLITKKVVIDREEAYLARKFGDEYRAYCARVRRWL